MSNMTEYELHTQGGVIAMSPKHDGRDPMRNRPHSNGTDTTMKIKRYGLDRDYSNNIGVPAIKEMADGAYVRYEDFQKMETAHKAHNEMLVLRTKKAESALDAENAVPVAYYYQYEDGWTAQCRFEGPGPLAVKPLYTAPVAAQPIVPEACDYLLRRWMMLGEATTGSEGTKGLARILVADTQALLAAAPTPPADAQALDHPIGWKISYTDAEGVRQSVLCCHNSVGDYRDIDPMASSIALGPFMPPPQQAADKSDAQPVGYFQNVNSANGLPPQYEQVSAVAKSDDDVFPLYRTPVATQPAPAMAGDESIAAVIRSIPVGYFSHVRRGQEANREAVAQLVSQRVQPASGEDA